MISIIVADDMPCSLRSPRPSLTPVRQLFAGIFKPAPVQLGKRNRNIDEEASISANTSATIHRPLKPLPKSRSRFALQMNDGDAVVITTLEDIPLCCPDELHAMSRRQLASVATILNKRLPRALAVDVGHQKSDNEIRNGIEFVLGLAKTAPRAPKRPGLRSESLDFQQIPHSPQSPLAGRSRRSMGSPYISRSPGLASLDEADEDMDIDNTSIKRRKITSKDTQRSPLARLSYQHGQNDDVVMSTFDNRLKAASIQTDVTETRHARARKPLCPITTQNMPPRRAVFSTPNLYSKGSSNQNLGLTTCMSRKQVIESQNRIPVYDRAAALYPTPTVYLVSPTSVRIQTTDKSHMDKPVQLELATRKAATGKCRRFSLRRRTEDLRQSVEDMHLRDDY